MAKVYVSSTILDLESERRAVMEWLRAARHQAVDSYLPNSETVRESCLNDIDGCDLYLLILGHRYGFQPVEENPEKLSITHLEFRRAGESGIPRIALLRTSIPEIKLSDIEDPQRAPLVVAFRSEVQSEVRPAEFRDLPGLIQGLSTGVQSELDKLHAPSKRQRAEGWVAAQLQEVARQFTSHMAASVLKSSTPPANLYIDLVVAERQLGRKEEASSGTEQTRNEGHSLEEVLKRAQAPLLLIGEGGCGKTTSLLYTAARASDRARSDQSGVVPIYVNLARLTKLEDTPDLHQLIADSVPLVKDWDELSELGIFARRRILFLFDSFNEIPEQLQRTCAVILSRFIEKQKKDHVCLLGSRLVPHIEQLSHPPSQFETFEILRLTSEQVQSFLQGLGLGSLYDRMPRELRELAGNPFMLLAIARTLAGKPESTLPRNRGKLYQSFAHEWMAREGQKQRGLSYSYERVKEPLLAYLAKRMTSAGQTLLVWSNTLEAEVETQLKEIHKNIERRGGMPKDWTVDHCLDEILRDGLLKRVNEQLHFMHQSVQEYFTSIYFVSKFPDALPALTPKLVWEFVTPYALAEVPTHRFVPTLLMMSGLLDDSTKIVEALAARNPILAAAAISSADRVDRALLATLEQSWLELLEHDDLRHRIVGCSCLVIASMRSPQVVQRLVAFALGPDFDNSYVGIPALGRLGAPDVIAFELAERARNLPDDEYSKLEHKIGEVMKVLQSERTVQILFEHWRASPPDSAVRRRFESLLATVDASLFKAELQRIQSGASDPAESAEAAKALAAGASWEKAGGIISARKIRERQAQAQKQYTDRTAKTLTTIRNIDDRELVESLRSSDPSMRAAAAALATARHAPVGDDILAAILRFDHYWSQGELISALVGLWGEQTTVSKLLEGSQQKCWCVGSLNPNIALQLTVGEIPEAVTTEIERLGVKENLRIEQHDSKGENSIWTLVPSAWGPFRPLYQLRGSPGRLELYDCNMPVRAFIALARIPGEASLNAFQSAVEHPDLDVRKIVIRRLADQGDPSLAARLLAQLRSAKSADFIDTALEALGVLRGREALSLMDDLFVLTDEEWSDRHPVWGPCPHSSGWGDAIHRTLVKLNADNDVQERLDKALAAEHSGPKVSALKELSRWFPEKDLEPERVATWRTPERLQQLLRLALSDPNESVRTTAGKALEPVKSEFVQRSLADALTNNEVEVKVAAAEALVRIKAHELYPQVSEVMLQVANANQAPEIRRRAGKVLKEIPDGVEPFYRPIQAELERGAWERALELITGTLEIIPEDVNLFWWRGYALRGLRRLDEAADTYQHAFELENQVQVIPQALAQTFVELGDYPRAMETARRGVEIAADNAEAQAILGWSSYKAGAVQDAVQAASMAVDLDPTHGYAIWVAILGHLRQTNVEESRSAFKQAMRVRQFLAPDLDNSSVASFLKELESINTDNDEISRLMKEIRDSLVSEGSGTN